MDHLIFILTYLFLTGIGMLVFAGWNYHEHHHGWFESATYERITIPRIGVVSVDMEPCGITHRQCVHYRETHYPLYVNISVYCANTKFDEEFQRSIDCITDIYRNGMILTGVSISGICAVIAGGIGVYLYYIDR